MQYIDFENELNERQYEAVSTTCQHVKVNAGAGSGKTRVLTYRIAYLINRFNVYPWTILAITFTNKVANEMKSRIIKMIPECEKDLTIRTFHSFAANFLRREISVLNYPSSFTILDEEDQTKLIKDIVAEMGFKRGDKIVGKALSYIGSCKLKEKYPEDITVSVPRFEDEKVCLEIYTRYEEEKTKTLCLDFDDLLLKANYILEHYPDIRFKWQNRIDHILVDEFQDTNDVEYKLINLLKKDTASLFVVGDGDQTIYTWRGANPDIIRNVSKSFKDMETITLDQNYRSTQVILDCANKLISKNVHRDPKNLYTLDKGGDKITWRLSPQSKSEAEYVAREIQSLVSQGYKYKDIAILYRSNYLTLDFENAFVGKHIPYTIYGGLKFYQRMEIKDVLAYFHLIVNTKDNISFDRIINVPRRGIGDMTQAIIRQEANDAGMSYYEYIRDVKIEDSSIPKKALNSLKAMIFNIDNARDKVNTSDEVFSKHLEELIYSIGYQNYLKDDDNADERLENVKQLFADIRHFLHSNPDSTFDEYLQNISLLSAQDEIVDADKVQMMTVHTAKGLEFPIVFIVKFNDGIFPNQRAMTEGGYNALEEERRLAYVAITRARKKLYVSYCSDFSYVLGSTLRPSMFIKEAGYEPDSSYNEFNPFINNRRPSSYHIQDEEPKKNRTFNLDSPIKQDLSSKTNDIIWKVGDIAIHTKFGSGVVTEIDGDGVLTINFDEHGEKSIMGTHPAISKGGNDA